MPERGDLAHAEDAARSEQTGGTRVQRYRGGFERTNLAGRELRSGGMVVVAVGGGDLLQQFGRSLRLRGLRQDRHDLQFALERDP